jgi:hypothetical protein
MATADKKEIIQRMEQMKDGDELSLRLAKVFGAGFVLIKLNASYPGKGEKKYVMRWGKTEADTKTLSPFIASDKAKKIAGWIADRAAEWIS